MVLTRTLRVLIALVVSGAVIIAAIGFAGSYAAVRELAERKGFGDFAVVFPIGIDAGICVLLALDLLLTWLRIPFPMLRQTAWLLTVATIAFNGAASWPDPLGVGMHAVIPVLFVVSVEAARHAVGRIADITADKHMEGVRITRWLLSPIPTFKLWRRMKLWELRSYEQVIKLEQDRLIYQARLQARYGRSWRRKAPVESMMPLRLAKYGVPLAETAPAGLAAAGIEPALLPPSSRAEAERVGSEQAMERGSRSAPAGDTEANLWGAAAVRRSGTRDAYRAPGQDLQGNASVVASLLHEPEKRDADGGSREAQQPLESAEIGFEDYREFTADHGSVPSKMQLRHSESFNLHAAETRIDDEPQRHPDRFVLEFEDGLADAPHSRSCMTVEENHTPEHETAALSTGGTDREPETTRSPVRQNQVPHVHVREGEMFVPGQWIASALAAGNVTTVDRYFLAWAAFQDQYGREPRDGELSEFLVAQGITGRGGGPVNPSTLRRYFLEFRIYARWVQLRAARAAPDVDLLLNELNESGITGQYGRPLKAEFVGKFLTGFERRWQSVAPLTNSSTGSVDAP
ncbi:DUF2637 domain-containing protein [Streptomyces achmelvichensis]|uniref:DUF2637 domain-containing protein n=1 Tax=Streptomyces achmelvichensis TaxID=3134111 RepID=UPI003C12BB6C